MAGCQNPTELGSESEARKNKAVLMKQLLFLPESHENSPISALLSVHLQRVTTNRYLHIPDGLDPGIQDWTHGHHQSLQHG